MRVVVSQPMFFPWSGLFEQVKLADVFVHYDDVEIAQGRSFMSRVQIKCHQGVDWLTVPIKRERKLIKDVQIEDTQRWRDKHIARLSNEYSHAQYGREMIAFVKEIYGRGDALLSELNIAAIEMIAGYLGLRPRFIRSSSFAFPSHSSQRLVEIVSALGGTEYVTGHGARNYLDHSLFESSGIDVQYMDYALRPYPQQHGPFSPYVSILDAVANVGRSASDLLECHTKSWKAFLNDR
jgi:hypothetical protein